MLSEKLDNKDCALLGKLLIQNNPDLATHYLSQIKGETDLSKIKTYYLNFCSINQIDDIILKGPIYKTHLLEKRRLFIAAILSIYKPHTRALSVSLANLLKMHKQNIGLLISEIKFQYKELADYKTEVDLMADKIKEV